MVADPDAEDAEVAALEACVLAVVAEVDALDADVAALVA